MLRISRGGCCSSDRRLAIALVAFGTATIVLGLKTLEAHGIESVDLLTVDLLPQSCSSVAEPDLNSRFCQLSPGTNNQTNFIGVPWWKIFLKPNPSLLNTHFWASSSLVYTSGYWVRWKAASSCSSCSPVNVVLLLRCFLLRAIPGSLSVSDSSPLLPPLTKTPYQIIRQWRVVFKF